MRNSPTTDCNCDIISPAPSTSSTQVISSHFEADGDIDVEGKVDDAKPTTTTKPGQSSGFKYLKSRVGILRMLSLFVGAIAAVAGLYAFLNKPEEPEAEPCSSTESEVAVIVNTTFEGVFTEQSGLSMSQQITLESTSSPIIPSSTPTLPPCNDEELYTFLGEWNLLVQSLTASAAVIISGALLIASCVKKDFEHKSKIIVWMNFGFHFNMNVILVIIGILLAISLAISEVEEYCPGYENKMTCSRFNIGVTAASFTILLGLLYGVIHANMKPFQGNSDETQTVRIEGVVVVRSGQAVLNT